MVDQIRYIPLDIIDKPRVAMRSDVHDDTIEDLASSIKKIGVLQPIIVRAVGERMEVIAGHRRVVASRIAGKVTIPAIVRDPSESDITVFKLHENLLRREVNPVDEAIFLTTIMKEHDYTIKNIVEMIKRSENYVSSRLEILSYPDYLIEAVGIKKISLGAAHWLAQIDNDTIRKNYVGYAINGGISVRRALAWYESWRIGAEYSNPLEIAETDAESGEEKTVHKEECIICRTHDVPEAMMLYYGHMDCVRKIAEVV